MSAAPTLPQTSRFARVHALAAPALAPCACGDERPVTPPPASRQQPGLHDSPEQPGQPDAAAVSAAARLLLNALSESVFAALSPATPTNVGVPPALADTLTMATLLEHFLSDAERQILKVIATAPPGQHISGQWVQSQCQIAKSTFWVLWGQLQVRDLVREVGAGKRRTYTLGALWVKLILD